MYKINVLILYNATQTYTNTVYEHLNSFARYSQYKFFYCHQDEHNEFNEDLRNFDVVILHYSVRLPYNQIAESTHHSLKRFAGLKVLFIQDEYDHTYRAWHWIKSLGMHLVFTVVPPGGIETVYPPAEFPGVRFVSNLTGYVPETIPGSETVSLSSSRQLLVGYRGRPLPARYGLLGQEKVAVGRLVKEYCEKHGIAHDIAWSEEARIYGPAWYDFMASCRSMLGSESGSNVFDWDGTLSAEISASKQADKSLSDEGIYNKIIAPREQHGLMNQISPRVFEAIALKTVLVLFEGTYSDVLTPGVHYIPLKKDGSNLAEVFGLLEDSDYVDRMAARAYDDIIASGRYSYRAFVNMVDREVASCLSRLQGEKLESARDRSDLNSGAAPACITTSPVRALPPALDTEQHWLYRVLVFFWGLLPQGVRERMKPRLKALLGRS